MSSSSVFLVLSVLIYSVSAVTNLQVATALENFEKILENRLAAQQAEIDILKTMISKTIDLVCDSDSCPRKSVPEPPKPNPTPDCPAPVPAPGI